MVSLEFVHGEGLREDVEVERSFRFGHLKSQVRDYACRSGHCTRAYRTQEMRTTP